MDAPWARHLGLLEHHAESGGPLLCMPLKNSSTDGKLLSRISFNVVSTCVVSRRIRWIDSAEYAAVGRKRMLGRPRIAAEPDLAAPCRLNLLGRATKNGNMSRLGCEEE